MDQVLDFSLVDKHGYTHGVFWPVTLVSVFMLWII